MIKTFLKVIGFIVKGIITIVIASILYNKTQDFWLTISILAMLWGIYGFIKWQNNVDRRLSVLEGKEGIMPSSGGIEYIIQLELEFDKEFFKTLQVKTGLSDETIKRIAADIPRVEFKIEEYVGDFTRTKAWYFWEEKERCVEDDNPKFYFQPYSIWSINFGKYLPEDDDTDIGGTRIRLVFQEGEFILALMRGKFGEKDCVDHYEPLKENILLCVKVYDYKGLEKHHLLYDEGYRDGTCSWYYSPKDNYREYAHPHTGSKIKDGIYWNLKWTDFTQKFLPKLKYKKGTCTAESVEFREEPIT